MSTPPRNLGGRPKIGGAVHLRLGESLLKDVRELVAEFDILQAEALRLAVKEGLPRLRKKLESRRNET